MKYFNIMPICLALCLLFSIPACNGAAGTQRPYVSNPPTVGTPEQFLVTIYNGTQWELDLGIGTILSGPSAGQTGHIILPVGSSATFDVGFLPGSVTVQAVTTSVPQIVYPAQTKTFNVDYGPFDTAIGFGIY